jgi:UDP-N-acetylmuramyl pentapeptide synthase
MPSWVYRRRAHGPTLEYHQLPHGSSTHSLCGLEARTAAQALAASVRVRYGDTCPTVGITGSCGKTTTRAMVQLVLAALGPVHATHGNLNNHVSLSLPLSLSLK